MYYLFHDPIEFDDPREDPLSAAVHRDLRDDKMSFGIVDHETDARAQLRHPSEQLMKMR